MTVPTSWLLFSRSAPLDLLLASFGCSHCSLLVPWRCSHCWISACSCIVCWLSLFWLASSLSATAFFSCSSPCLSCLLSFLRTHSFSCASVIISPPWSTEQIPSLQLHGPDAVFPAKFQEQLFHSAADGSRLVRSSCLSCNLRNSTGAVAWSGSSPWAVFAAVQGAPFLQASLCLAQH